MNLTGNIFGKPLKWSCGGTAYCGYTGYEVAGAGATAEVWAETLEIVFALASMAEHAKMTGINFTFISSSLKCFSKCKFMLFLWSEREREIKLF